MKKEKVRPSGNREAKIQFPVDGYSIAHNLKFQQGLYILVVSSLLMLFINYWPNSEGVIKPRIVSLAHGAFTSPAPIKKSNDLQQVALVAELVEKEKELVYSEEKPGGQFVLVMASMRNVESALEMQFEQKDQALDLEIVEDLSNDQKWYRVVAKRSNKKSQVARLARKLDFETWMTSLSDQARIVLKIE